MGGEWRGPVGEGLSEVGRVAMGGDWGAVVEGMVVDG